MNTFAFSSRVAILAALASFSVLPACAPVEEDDVVASEHDFTRPGTPDSSFGVDGVVTLGSDTFFPPRDRWFPARSVVEQPDGKVLVVALTQASRGSTLTRLTRSGALDPTFGTAGKVTMDGYYYWQVSSLPSGRILLVGHDRLMRLEADGSLDASFGVNGVTSISAPDFGVIPAGTKVGFHQVQTTDAGRIFYAVPLGPYASGTLRLVALDDEGNFDPTFNGGQGSLEVGRGLANSVDVAIAGGAVYVSEQVVRVTNSGFGIRRYRLDGSGVLDAAWADNGRAFLASGGGRLDGTLLPLGAGRLAVVVDRAGVTPGRITALDATGHLDLGTWGGGKTAITRATDFAAVEPTPSTAMQPAIYLSSYYGIERVDTRGQDSTFDPKLTAVMTTGFGHDALYVGTSAGAGAVLTKLHR